MPFEYFLQKIAAYRSTDREEAGPLPIAPSTQKGDVK